MPSRRAYRMVDKRENTMAVRPQIALTAPDTELSV
jgi:hypothetical protein